MKKNEDLKNFKGLKRVLAYVDIILNPKATDWPFLYTYYIQGQENYILPPRHIVIKKFREGNYLWFWCIRYLR